MSAHWHHEAPGCPYAAGGTSPAVGDVVTLCTADRRWQVLEVADELVELKPLPGTPGHKWMQPLIAHVAHLDLAGASL